MFRIWFLLGCLLSVGWAFQANAEQIRTKRNVPYVEGSDSLQSLDVYTPADLADRPVLVWIHGGGWRKGDKSNVGVKPAAFVDQGFIFVSVNYRLFPKNSVKEQASDVAAAIAWVHAKAKENGADAGNIFVAGDSAGAHLAALVCTDGRYLKAQGLSPADIRGCIPVDTAMYDAVDRFKNIREFSKRLYVGPFTEESKTQAELSPITYAAGGKSLPRFLILHVADRVDSTSQSKRFANAINDAGGKATTYAAVGKTHGTINRDLGRRGDDPTKAIFEFLSELIESQDDDAS